MKKMILGLFAVLALSAPLSCASAGMTDGDALSGATVVLDRHDAYAVALLDGVDEMAALSQSERVRAYLEASKGVKKVAVAAIRPDAAPVIQRHQMWVSADDSLTADEKRVYLRSGELFGALLED